MAELDGSTHVLHAKIVYYGPGMSGKTTNVEVLEQRARRAASTGLTRLATDTSRTLFFDAISLDLGEIAGLRTRFQIFTVPGQIFYEQARRVVLEGADGVVFVADSRPESRQANRLSLATLERCFTEFGQVLDPGSVVIQYNKRDAPDAMPVEEMERELNPEGWTAIEACARDGIGVEETVRAICGLVHRRLRVNYHEDRSESA